MQTLLLCPLLASGSFRTMWMPPSTPSVPNSVLLGSCQAHNVCVLCLGITPLLWGSPVSRRERAADSRVCALAGRRTLDHACDALFRYHVLLKLTLVSFGMVEVLNLKQIKNIILKESKYHAESKILQELSYCCSSHGSYTRYNKGICLCFFFLLCHSITILGSQRTFQ